MRLFFSGSITPCTLQCSSSHLVVVQVCTCFKRHKGDLYRFHCRFCACWAVRIHLFFVLTNLSLLPTILSDFWVGLSSDRKPVFGIIIHRNCYQLFLHWRLKFWINLSYLIFLFQMLSRPKKYSQLGRDPVDRLKTKEITYRNDPPYRAKNVKIKIRNNN